MLPRRRATELEHGTDEGFGGPRMDLPEAARVDPPFTIADSLLDSLLAGLEDPVDDDAHPALITLDGAHVPGARISLRWYRKRGNRRAGKEAFVHGHDIVRSVGKEAGAPAGIDRPANSRPPVQPVVAFAC
ncbi:unannotated protein [freshwater metagenome]|uniref:Unannotated protein n=1 Tax=freshwater metagenome TaxID=449393 RepID=A0A6J7MZV7_9ZZZZ